MSDLNTKNQDISSLISDIEIKESELDNEIKKLEQGHKEINNLEKEKKSIYEKLSGIEGNALEIAQKEISQKLEEKQKEIEESENKISEIGDELQKQQGELQNEIGEYDAAIEEIGIAEKECDVDLSQSKDAANSDREELIDASSKIDEILGKISSALSDSDTQKNKLLDVASQGINNILKGAGDFTRKVTSSTMMFSALLGGCISTYDKIISPILDINDKLISRVVPDNSAFSIISNSLNDAKEKALGKNIGDYEDLETIQELKNKKREDEEEIASRIANEPKIS
jgi:myosin heavy subunit